MGKIYKKESEKDKMIGFPPPVQLTKWGHCLEFPNFLNSKDCDFVIDQMSMLEPAKISQDGKTNELVRAAKIAILPFNISTGWLFERLKMAISDANCNTYGFDLLGFGEPINLIQYKEGDHYDWHMDSGNLAFSLRKLSVVIQLSDPLDYEGGELEFFKFGDAKKERGMMFLFPSYMMHRVRAVTKGTRRSLVAWVNGIPFR